LVFGGLASLSAERSARKDRKGQEEEEREGRGRERSWNPHSLHESHAAANDYILLSKKTIQYSNAPP